MTDNFYIRRDRPKVVPREPTRLDVARENVRETRPELEQADSILGTYRTQRVSNDFAAHHQLQHEIFKFLQQRVESAANDNVILPEIPVILHKTYLTNPKDYLESVNEYEEQVSHVYETNPHTDFQSVYDFMANWLATKEYYDSANNVSPYSYKQLGAFIGGLLSIQNKSKYDLALIGSDLAVVSALAATPISGGASAAIAFGANYAGSTAASAEQTLGFSPYYEQVGGQHIDAGPVILESAKVNGYWQGIFAGVATTPKAFNAAKNIRASRFSEPAQSNFIHETLKESFKEQDKDQAVLTTADNALRDGVPTEDVLDYLDNNIKGLDGKPKNIAVPLEETANMALEENYATNNDIHQNILEDQYERNNERYRAYQQAANDLEKGLAGKTGEAAEITRTGEDGELSSFSISGSDQARLKYLQDLEEIYAGGNNKITLDENNNVYFTSNNFGEIATGTNINSMTEKNALGFYLESRRMFQFAENAKYRGIEPALFPKATTLPKMLSLFKDIFNSAQMGYTNELLRHEPLRKEISGFNKQFKASTTDIDLLKLRALYKEMDTIQDPRIVNYANTVRRSLDLEQMETSLSGNNIGYLENYVPHFFDKSRMFKPQPEPLFSRTSRIFRREELPKQISAESWKRRQQKSFVDFMMDKVDWEKINIALERDDLGRIEPNGRIRFLQNYYDSFIDNDRKKYIENHRPKKKFAAKTRSRYLFFKDADSHYATILEYGHKDLDQNVLRHIENSVRKRINRSVIGEGPIDRQKETFIRLSNQIMFGVDRGFAGKKAPWQEKIMYNFIGASLEEMVGFGDYYGSPVEAAFGNIMNFRMAALLGTSTFSTLMDYSKILGNMSALENKGMFKQLVQMMDLAFLSRISKEEAEEFIRITEGNWKNSRQKSNMGFFSRGTGQAAVEFVLDKNFTNSITGFSKRLNYQWLGRTLAKNNEKLFTELPKTLQKALKEAGISAKEWDKIRKTPLHETLKGDELLLPYKAIETLDRNTYNKLFLFFEREIARGVPESNLGIRRITQTIIAPRSARLSDAILSLRGAGLEGMISFYKILGRFWDQDRLTGVSNATTMFAMELVLAYINSSLRRISQGKKPLRMETEEDWIRLVEYSDIAGTVLDLLHGTQREPEDFAISLFGVNASGFASAIQVTQNVGRLGADYYYGEDAANDWLKFYESFNRFLPVGRFAVGGIVLQREILDQLPYLFMPDTASYYELKKDYEDYYWKKGAYLPGMEPHR